ncbi:unnamed protein product [Moneuplotes crassus]|uniref:Uncharacterized protein n=1 Tax=Euplotes crassus TaxID=5936 RepID=A0AAD2D4C4_EUPCR|nr:unnamed protein product [Moneuplotes crassus]
MEKIRKLPKDPVRADAKFKIVIIGEASVGKTSFLIRFTQGKYTDEYEATIGVDFQAKSLAVGSKIVKLQVWDTAGQEKFKSITRTYYNRSHGCLVLYDISDDKSFEKAKGLIQYYKEESEATLPFNVILVGNKCDLEEQRKVSTLEGRILAQEYSIPFFETSVKEDIGVDEVFAKIAVEAMKGDKDLEDSIVEDAMKLHNVIKKPKKKSRCC